MSPKIKVPLINMGTRGTRPSETKLLKIVDDDFLADALENFLHEFDVLRVDLIRLLGGFAGKNHVQRHLIGLVHDRPRAGRHLADVKLQHAGNVLEVLVGAGDQFIRRVGLRRIRPENNDV